MRRIYPFNHQWLFAPHTLAFDSPDDRFVPVTLPHSNRLSAHRTTFDDEYQFESTYRKRFHLPEQLNGQIAFLDFDGAMQLCRVYLNDELVGQHAGGYTPFSVEITQQLQPGENTLHVLLDSRELAHIPPNGYRMDYLPFGGIYRDVRLRLVSPAHIATVFVHPQDVLGDCRLRASVELSRLAEDLVVSAALTDDRGKLIARMAGQVEQESVRLESNKTLEIEPWSIENPVLYRLELTLNQNGSPLDSTSTRVGFRTAEFRADGKFYLNGTHLKLMGLSRHQTYPFIGAAAPARLQRQDADILKFELGCNIVRTSHYPQSPIFLDRCDEIGLLVFEELPGWQHIGDQDWQDLLLSHMREMIVRDRNHPCIVLWGTRVNESPDNDELYQRTHAMARQLDPTRQTGGVRDSIDSSFLEDVFTFNDFNPGLTQPRHTPHLITEFGGHRYPTKIWDNEDRLIEHALVHARKHDLQLGRPDIAGAIGWCAFDYHTHAQFGSGDRICHHGVMSIFRLPKWAAYFYRSQKPPEQEVVLKAATYWTLGDRSGGGNNPLTVFSNCDEIEIFIAGESLGRFSPNREEFPNLYHPPFTIRWPEPYDPWSDPNGDLRVVGYLEGEAVIQQDIAADHRPIRLTLRSDTQELIADGADMTRLIVGLVDRFGNPLPYQHRVVEFELRGDAELLGENPLALIGGEAACFVRAGHTAGPVEVEARCAGFETATVSLRINPS